METPTTFCKSVSEGLATNGCLFSTLAAAQPHWPVVIVFFRSANDGQASEFFTSQVNELWHLYKVSLIRPFKSNKIFKILY
jgi:hypothetical protein